MCTKDGIIDEACKQCNKPTDTDVIQDAIEQIKSMKFNTCSDVIPTTDIKCKDLPQLHEKIFIDGDFNDSYESRIQRSKHKKK